MGLSEILDVNIVADRRTIARWIISPVDIDVRPLSQRSLQHQWNEVGFWLCSSRHRQLGICRLTESAMG